MLTLQQSILKTLSFFDLFSQPLTVQEVYRFLYCPPADVSEGDVRGELLGLGDVESVGGVFRLKGGRASIEARGEHVRMQIQKMKRARRAIRLIRLVPFVRAVFVCNTVGFGVPTKQSDIDVLVIAKDARIFLTRFLVTCVLSLFGLRRHGGAIQNKVCLSFYLSERTLSLQSIAIERDIYLAHWIALLIPVYDPNHVYEKILQQNEWVKKMLPHALQPYISAVHIRVNDSLISRFTRVLVGASAFSRIWTFGESITKRLQLWWMKDKLGRSRKISSAVIVSDSMLKFHEEDRRMVYRDEWESKWRM